MEAFCAPGLPILDTRVPQSPCWDVLGELGSYMCSTGPSGLPAPWRREAKSGSLGGGIICAGLDALGPLLPHPHRARQSQAWTGQDQPGGRPFGSKVMIKLPSSGVFEVFSVFV